MKKLSKLILVFILGNISSSAQATDTAWTKTYGGPADDRGFSVQQTTDGGYIVAGYTSSYGAGDDDVYIIKTDSLGDTLWTKTYGGSNSDRGFSVQQTTDGGYIVVGYTYSYGTGGDNVYIIKTDSVGDTLWTKTYRGSGYSVQQTTDGGYIVTGCIYNDPSNDDVYIIKTDSLGDTLWTKEYGWGPHFQGRREIGYSVRQTTDGGYFIVGYGQSFDDWDEYIYLIKTDSNGDTLWTKTSGGLYYRARVGQQTTDGGYIVVGTDDYIYLIKTDTLGDNLWMKIYGDSTFDCGYCDQGHSVQQTTDGGYIVAGVTSYNGTGEYDVYIIKTDSLGDTLWTKTYGDSADDGGFSVQQTTDGGYIIAGYTYSYGAGDSDIYLIKLKPEETWIKEEIITGLLFLSPADPNPFSSNTIVRYELTESANVNIEIYDILGQKIRDIFSGRQSSGIHSVSWDGSGNRVEKLSSGIYFLRFEVEGQSASRKLLFVK